MAISSTDTRILFINYDIITYFLNLASCSEHFISIKLRILAIFYIKKKKINLCYCMPLTNIKVVSMCIQLWRCNIKTWLGIRVLLAQLWRSNIKAGLGIHVVFVQPWRCNIKTELGIRVVLPHQWRVNIKT